MPQRLYSLNTATWTTNPVSGVREQIPDAYRLSLTPNPAEDYITVQLPLGTTAGNQIRILDSTGKVVLEQEVLQDQSNQLKLALNELAGGIYHLLVITDGRTYFGRFMVRRD